MNLEDRVGAQDEAAAALFAAARAYRAPVRARRRALRALGLPVGFSLLASSSAQAAGALLSTKGWIALVLATAGAIGGAIGLATPPRTPAPRSAHEQAPTPRARAKARPAPAQTPAPAQAARPTPTLALAQTSTPIRTPPPRATRARVTLDGPPAAPRGGPDLSSLRAELALIADARTRLRAGDAGGALGVLDGYASRFPEGAMTEEVDLLTLRALVAAGDRSRARRLGEAFLARHPASPLAGAVRARLDSLSASGPEQQEGDQQ
jgi:hypothetical protein